MELITELYEHQKKAFEKLIRIKVGALYLDMGTGKTRTTLELIKRRLEKGKINHILWLCPYSVKRNLEEDIIKHTGEFNKNLFTICGIETLSSSIKTNLKLLELVENKKCYLIVDESNLIKNPFAKRTKNILRLSEKCTYKLILNGTPISKNESDLYAQWLLLDWRILGYKSFWSFSANHLEYDPKIKGKIRRCLNVDYLVEKIAPYTYQVKKDECLDLPEKTYEKVYYNLTNKQDEHYLDIANQLLFEVDELEPHTIYRMFTGLQNVISGFKVTVKSKLEKELFFNDPYDNPRIRKFMSVIDDISEYKVIVFCKYTEEITTIVKLLNEEYGENVAIPFFGEIKQKQRHKNIDMFKGESRFLVANKTCGAYGLNLQFCNYIIYYSNDWDYATRSQSEDRVHRIGQDKNVHIIDICCNNTLDERILSCLRKKENLVDSFKSEIDKSKDRKDLFTWITKRDYNGKKYSKKVELEKCEELQEI